MGDKLYQTVSQGRLTMLAKYTKGTDQSDDLKLPSLRNAKPKTRVIRTKESWKTIKHNKSKLLPTKKTSRKNIIVLKRRYKGAISRQGEVKSAEAPNPKSGMFESFMEMLNIAKPESHKVSRNMHSCTKIIPNLSKLTCKFIDCFCSLRTFNYEFELIITSIF